MSTLDTSDVERSRRSASYGRRKIDEVASSSTAHGLILTLYTLTVVWPISLQLGPVYMTTSRLLIIILIVPMLLRLVSGRYGGLKLPDYFVIFYCIWAYIALSANHGIGEVSEFAVMFFMETTGAYLVGRIYIRNMADFTFFIKCLLITILFSIPFVLLEMRTGQPIILETLRAANPIPNIITLPENVNYIKRMGLERSQFTLAHPIFYGVFCASLMALALTVHTRAKGTGSKVFWGLVVWMATFASLSSAALLSAMLQLMILGFERMTRFIKTRWKLLAFVFVVIYVALDISSDRSPIVIFVSIFSFSGATAWNRVLIWEFGSAEVWRHPFFGIGNNDWVRPSWMVPSIDNHWLLQTMRYGLPGGILLMGAVLWCLIKIGTARVKDNFDLVMAQRGYMAAMVGWCISLGTVAINVEINSYFMTLLASGIWMIDAAQRENEGDTRARGAKRVSRAGREPRESSRQEPRSARKEKRRPLPPRRRDPAARR